MIEGYKKVFAMLGLSLKCVASSSNGISKIVQTDNKLADKCPMLLVQIDPHFLSLDLYENGQLSFTRFVAISENDYDDKNDYVFEAVNENIFRMFQFQKSRSNRSIRNVVFYGDTSQYIRLTNALEQMDISTQILKVPSQVYGYENFEFANYANAIGMMFKRNKDTEAINLMGTDLASVARSEVSGSSAGAKAIIAFLVCALAVGSVYAYFSISNSAKLEDIKAIDQYISSESVQSKLKDVELKESQLSKLEVLKQRIEGVTKAYKSYPILKTSTLDRITERLPDNGSVAAIAYKDGIVAMECSSATMQDPSTFVEKLYQLSNLFVAYDYTGYKVEQNTSINLVTGNPVIQLGEESNDYVVGVMLRGEEEIAEEEPVPAAN